jgi:hypothetical protein
MYEMLNMTTSRKEKIACGNCGIFQMKTCGVIAEQDGV